MTELPFPDVDTLVTLETLLQVSLAEDAPAFGSREWLELGDDDPRRLAAMLTAAYCWWAAEHGIGRAASAARLAQLVDQQVEQRGHEHVEAFEAAIDEVLACVEPEKGGKSPFVLRARLRRAEQLAQARAPRDEDHLGGSVPWSTPQPAERNQPSAGAPDDADADPWDVAS